MIEKLDMTAFKVVLIIAAIVTSFIYHSTQASSPQQIAFPTTATILQNANLRDGPGINYSVIGGTKQGALVRITGCNQDCTWYELDNEEWIAAFLVELSSEESTLPSPATQPLNIITWNVESGGADPEIIGRRIEAFQGIDLWGLQEVNSIADSQIYEQSAEKGESTDFQRILGVSGGGDRLLALVNTTRFEIIEAKELTSINTTGNARAALVIHLREKASNQDLLFMVNHLYRSQDSERHEQARLLNKWASEQTLPIIAVGDYNFDWAISNGEAEHDLGYDYLVEDDIFRWIQPSRLVTTQCSGWPCQYNSILDFIFTAGPENGWRATSEIIVQSGDFPDDENTSDHRPVMAQVWLSGEPTSERTIVIEETSMQEVFSAVAVAPTATATFVSRQPTANSNANLRGGPGTNYPIVGSVQAGQVLSLEGRNPAGDWYQLDSGWIAAFLVNNVTTSLPIRQAPSTAVPVQATTVPQPTVLRVQVEPTATPTEPVEPAPQEATNIQLLILKNTGKEEVLGLRNNGAQVVDISGSKLDGSKGNDSCQIPSGTHLSPGQTYTIATGDSQPTQPGFKCGDKPIWNNNGETIYYHRNGQTTQIESRRVQ